MRPPSCVACDLPVLELRGQFTVLQPYLIEHGVPPSETAGAWHLPCLESSSVGQLWHQAKLRSYVNVRGYELLARTSRWSVVRNPRTREVLALGAGGDTLALGTVPARPVVGGAVELVTEPSYGLEYDPPVIREIQQGLRATGRYAVRAVADRLGIGDRLAHPDLLDGAAFRLDAELEPEWLPQYVLAAVDYPVFVPDELAPYAGGTL
jgi:hypothetical protein